VYLTILLKQKKTKNFLTFFTLANCAGKSTYFLGSKCIKDNSLTSTYFIQALDWQYQLNGLRWSFTMEPPLALSCVCISSAAL